jgi:branched-chain amino acid transport system permease protein
VSLNLLTGFAGIISVGHAAFFGVGAYTSALMAINLGSPFFVNVICAALLGGAAGGAVGIPSARIKDDYFLIGTFAFQIIAFSVFNNWMPVTGGPLGVTGIPQPQILLWSISSQQGFLLLAAFFLAAVLWTFHRIVDSPFGRVLRVIREDESFAESAGKNVRYFKLVTFVISSAVASIAGAIYACYVGFIDPTSFSIDTSILIVSMMIIGGAGRLAGSVLGAVLLIALPELLRFVGVSGSQAANVRQILFGIALIVFMVWRPQGLLGTYAFQRKVERQ